MGPPGQAELRIYGGFDDYAHSVDQRVNMSGRLELFEERGGKVIYHTVATSDLEGLSALYELTIIAAGKGELVELFERDASRSPYDRPQRHLAVAYVHGMKQWSDDPKPHVRINAAPGLGELFYMPALTTSGPCHIVFWEAVPGGPFDVWADRPSAEVFIQRTREVAGQYLPWEAELMADAEPADDRCTLYGGYPPVVRKPIGQITATAKVLGMGDVVVANDPDAGQGANNAAHCARIYRQRILDHGDRPFDEAWMEGTFEAYWEYARHATEYTNMLIGPLPEHVQQVLGAASQNPVVARRFAYGYSDPTDFENWLMDPAKAQAYLGSVMGQPS